MKDVSSCGGRTVLFVSHNMDSIRKLCNHGIYLENGMLKMQGSAEEVINEYLNMNLTFEGVSLAEYPREAGCNGKVKITKIEFFDNQRNLRNLQCGSHCQIKLYYETTQEQVGCHFAYAISNSAKGTRVSFNTKYTADALKISKGFGSILCDIPNLPLTAGRYTIDFYVSSTEGKCDHIIGYPIEILGGDFFKLGGASADLGLSGVMLTDHRWYDNNGNLLSIFRGKNHV